MSDSAWGMAYSASAAPGLYAAKIAALKAAIQVGIDDYSMRPVDLKPLMTPTCLTRT